MAITYPIPDELYNIWENAQDWLTRILGKSLDPNANAQPPKVYENISQPKGIQDFLSKAIIPDIKDAFIGGIASLAPGYITSKDNMAALLESPLYLGMSPTERLALAKGVSGNPENVAFMASQVAQGNQYTQAMRELADKLGVSREELIPFLGKHAVGK